MFFHLPVVAKASMKATWNDFFRDSHPRSALCVPATFDMCWLLPLRIFFVHSLFWWHTLAWGIFKDLACDSQLRFPSEKIFVLHRMNEKTCSVAWQVTSVEVYMNVNIPTPHPPQDYISNVAATSVAAYMKAWKMSKNTQKQTATQGACSH